MDINEGKELPIVLQIGFNKLLERYKELAESSNGLMADRAKYILKAMEPFPVLRQGFSESDLLDEYKDQIDLLLTDSFNEVLAKNEIKTASIPFQDIIFNSSDRFQKIIRDAGPDFKLHTKNLPEDDMYRICCVIILMYHYGYEVDFKRPFFYEIPDAKGIMRYYKILYNADFMEVLRADGVPEITLDDYYELLDNYDNMALWREKFPLNGYIFRGFVIANIFDVTPDQSLSNVKSKLIAEESAGKGRAIDDFHEMFRSLMGIKDLQIGFSSYDMDEEILEHLSATDVPSYLLQEDSYSACKGILCEDSYERLIEEKQFYAISDVVEWNRRENRNDLQLKRLEEMGVRSAIFAPIADGDELLGILELVSKQPKVLNSINAQKLTEVMPFLVAEISRSKENYKNLIEAVVQHECTAIHPSVYWKFEREAKRFLQEETLGRSASFNEISFAGVYPLYGQIDIQGSSQARLEATKLDLSEHLGRAITVLELLTAENPLPIYEQLLFQTRSHQENIAHGILVDTEQRVTDFFNREIYPLLQHLWKDGRHKDLMEGLYPDLEGGLQIPYYHRQQYDATITKINKKMAQLLDRKQEEAQEMFPHYFERFKTDGVEHNMYIGESIAHNRSFSPAYLSNLRLWQLQVLCEMENAYYRMKPGLQVDMDVTSMVLVFNSPLTISFRMDEKQFDVDGTYNARYEIVKKRVDKAFIKGTRNRIVEKGKLTIVYSSKEDEKEYLGYIAFLQSKKYLGTEVEILDLEDLQAVTGLKALRANILYHTQHKDSEGFYTYEDLMEELKGA